MPKSTVTNIGKITQTEAEKYSRKVRFLPQFHNEEHVKLMEKLIDIMEDDDDVQNIWHNWEE